MNFPMRYAQAFSWLSVPIVAKDLVKAIRTILIEVVFILICAGWIICSPLTALWGSFYPGKLLDFLKWSNQRAP